MPARDDRRHRPRRQRRSMGTRPAASPPARAGQRPARSTSVTMPERPLRADERRPARSSAPVALQPDHLAVGQHDSQPSTWFVGEAVLQAVGAAGVLGDVAADRAHLLARRVGRVVEPVRRDRAASRRGWSRRAAPAPAGWARRPRGCRFIRARPMTMPSATGTAPPERPVPAPRATNGTPWARAHPHRRLPPPRSCAAAPPPERHRPVARQAVALVRPQLRGLEMHGSAPSAARDRRPESRDQRNAALRHELGITICSSPPPGRP